MVVHCKNWGGAEEDSRVSRQTCVQRGHFCDIVRLIMREQRFLTVYAFGLVALAISSSLAAQPASQSIRDSTVRDPNAVQPERPTVATHAGTVTRGWVELEEGGEWDKAADGKRLFFAPTNLKIGLAPRAQLNVLVSLITDPSRGTSLAVSDITFGVKYRIVDDAPIVGDFAILPAIKLPSASTSFAGTGTYDFSLLLISCGNGSRSIQESSSQLREPRRTRSTLVLSGTWAAWRLNASAASSTRSTTKKNTCPEPAALKAGCSEQVVLFVAKKPI
jgi:hypothetical protein